MPNPAALSVAVRADLEHIPGVNFEDKLGATHRADDDATARADPPLLYPTALVAPLGERDVAPHARTVRIAFYDLLRQPVELRATSEANRERGWKGV